MSKKKEIICIGVSYSAPYFYLAAYSFHTFDECLFLNKTLSLDTKKYSSAIWVSSLPYALFDIHELTTIESSQSLKQKQQIQYMGLKNGVHFWQCCQINQTLFQEQLNVLDHAKATMHVLELDLLAIWDYAFFKTLAPFKTRLVLWQKAPYLIGILGRECSFWKIWYWPIDKKLDFNWWQEILISSLPMPELISCLSQLTIEVEMTCEEIYLRDKAEYVLAIALAHRGLRHAL